jgi:hypothetical protein
MQLARAGSVTRLSARLVGTRGPVASAVPSRQPVRTCPEWVELIRAAVLDANRARFEQDLDQALDMARSTRDLRPLGRLWRAGGGWCWLVSTVAGGGRRPRHASAGC